MNGKLTDARKTIIRSARLYPPAAWVVDRNGHRTGFEREAWKRNCKWLEAAGYLRESPFNDWYLTDAGEALLVEIEARR